MTLVIDASTVVAALIDRGTRCSYLLGGHDRGSCAACGRKVAALFAADYPMPLS